MLSALSHLDPRITIFFQSVSTKVAKRCAASFCLSCKTSAVILDTRAVVILVNKSLDVV